MSKDTVLHLEIDDSYRLLQEFDLDSDYPDSDDDEMNEVRVSVLTETDTIAYMKFDVFYGNKIDDLVMFADGISQDAHEAMYALDKNGFLEPFDFENGINEDFFTAISTDIVYLQYIAVREDYRNKGIGSWLIKNLPRILSRNYGIVPKVIITSITPQIITWDESAPSFMPPEEDAPLDKTMYNLMEKLFIKHGYQRLNNSNHYILNSFK